MALHTKILKHNILRVSKLTTLSNTTQAIERNFDRNATINPEHSNILVNGESKTCANLEKESADVRSFPMLAGNLNALCDEKPDQFSLSFGFEQFFAMYNQQLPILCSHEKELSNKALHQVEMHGDKLLNTPLHRRDPLTQIGTPWNYTTDDIVVSNWKLKRDLSQDIILFESHRVSHFADSPIHRSFDIKRDLRQYPPLSHKQQLEQGRKTQFRRHSVCDPHLRNYDLEISGNSSTVGESVALCSPGSTKETSKGIGGDRDKPSADRLKAVEQYFIEKLPTFFKSRQDYSMYHPDIMFENNFWGENTVSVGINQYALQLMKLRAMTHLKYAHVNMEVISSKCIHEENMVRIHWRVEGLSQLKALRFWKYTPWKYSSSFKEDAEWIDGISLLYVNKDGLVTKHRMDRMTPDEEQTAKVPSLAAKLALILGLAVPKADLSDFSSLLFRR